MGFAQAAWGEPQGLPNNFRIGVPGGAVAAVIAARIICGIMHLATFMPHGSDLAPYNQTSNQTCITRLVICLWAAPTGACFSRGASQRAFPRVGGLHLADKVCLSARLSAACHRSG